MQKNKNKYVTNDNNREQLSKYDADFENVTQEKNDDEDVVEVAMVKLHYAYEALEREVRELEGVLKDDALFLDDSIDESSNILKPQTTINQGAFVLEDLKAEVDEMIKQKVNLEVQYIALSSQHMHTMNRLEIAERKAIELRGQYDKLKMTTCDKMLDNEDVWNVRNSVCKSASMFGIQLVLLALVVYLVVQKIFSRGMEDELATT